MLGYWAGTINMGYWAGTSWFTNGNLWGNTEKSVILKASSSKPSIWYGITKQIVS